MVARSIYSKIKEQEVYPRRVYLSDKDVGEHVVTIKNVTVGENRVGEEFFGVTLDTPLGERNWISKPSKFPQYHLRAVKGFLLAATGLANVSESDVLEAASEAQPLLGVQVRLIVSLSDKQKRDGGHFVEIAFAPL